MSSADVNLQFACGGAEFTIGLFQKLIEGGLKENIIFSPFSIQTCMALAFAGAEGETADEIAKVMKFVSNSKSEVATTFNNVLEKYKNSPLLKIANKVYVQQGHNLRAEYAATTTKSYHAEAAEINFEDSEAAAQTINAWVENKTAGKIKDLVQANLFNSLTRLVLLNALHFKGDWAFKFNESHTAEEDFWINKDNAVKVNFMNQREKFNYGYFEDLKCQVIEMPYKDSDLSMLVFLPDERDGLKDLVEKIKDVHLLNLSDELSELEISVKFPKFKIDYSVDLCDVLKKLGITQAFGGGANFSNILEPSENLFISNILHKACIEVNEEGSEAAAATAVVMMLRCALINPEFYCDHPFLYMIWDKKNILFAGAFVNAS